MFNFDTSNVLGFIASFFAFLVIFNFWLVVTMIFARKALLANRRRKHNKEVKKFSKQIEEYLHDFE